MKPAQQLGRPASCLAQQDMVVKVALPSLPLCAALIVSNGEPGGLPGLHLQLRNERACARWGEAHGTRQAGLQGRPRMRRQCRVPAPLCKHWSRPERPLTVLLSSCSSFACAVASAAGWQNPVSRYTASRVDSCPAPPAPFAASRRPAVSCPPWALPSAAAMPPAMSAAAGGAAQSQQAAAAGQLPESANQTTHVAVACLLAALLLANQLVPHLRGCPLLLHSPSPLQPGPPPLCLPGQAAGRSQLPCKTTRHADS